MSFLSQNDQQNSLSHRLIVLLSEKKTTVVSSCVRKERGRPLAEVQSVEPVLSSFLMRPFDILLFLSL